MPAPAWPASDCEALFQHDSLTKCIWKNDEQLWKVKMMKNDEEEEHDDDDDEEEEEHDDDHDDDDDDDDDDDERSWWKDHD